MISKDEHPKPDVTAEKLKAMKALFKKDGTVTAATASGIVDGAAMSVLMTEAEAKKRGLKPLAKLVSWASVGCDPKMMGIGPAGAIRAALEKVNMKLEQMDLVEVNEAFAAQYLAVEKELGLDRNKTNVNGGAIAVGHPLGASGTRIMNHLTYELARRNGKYAVGSACIGGGQGIAIIIEKFKDSSAMPIESTESSFKLQDRTALITGPCNSFNQAIAVKLTQLGANVALVDRNVDRSQRFATQLTDAREINERYGRAVAVQADLSKPHHVQDAISRSAEAFGGIDIYIDGLMTTDVKRFKEPSALEDLDRMIDVNLRAPLLMTHGVLRFLEGRKRGRIIYLMHDIARMGLASNGLMAVARTGLSAFARTLSREVAENNVTVNCLAIGITEEFLLGQDAGGNAGATKTSIQEAQARLSKDYPQAVLMDTEKIASTVAFLASPLGSGITGQTIAVSQGMSYFS